MAKQELKANDKIHGVGEKVTTIEIVLKGSVSQSIPGKGTPVVLRVGSIIGLAETPNEPYQYQYVASSDSVIYSYSYDQMSDLDKVIHANQKISPVIASSAVKSAYALYAYAKPMIEEAKTHREKLLKDYADYPALCNSLGTVPKDFPVMKDLREPDPGMFMAA